MTYAPGLHNLQSALQDAVSLFALVDRAGCPCASAQIRSIAGRIQAEIEARQPDPDLATDPPLQAGELAARIEAVLNRMDGVYGPGSPDDLPF